MFQRKDNLLSIFMTDGELNEIYQTLNSFGENSIITEWGSGGSTVSWLYNLKPSQTFVSIEHNNGWYDKVTKIINDNKSSLYLDNFKYFYIPKNGSVGSESGQFDSDEGCNAYCDGPQDFDVFNSNVYFVDGLSRKKCIETIFKKAKKRSAVVYCHDFSSNRGRYDSLLTLFPNHIILDEKISLPNNLMLKLFLE